MSELPIKGSEAYDRLVARFWPKVTRLVGEQFCWEWKAAQDPSGYGRIGIDRTRSRLAHHVSFYLAHDLDPRGSVVMHLCDNPPCVNPAHLELGTHRTNAQDKVSKRRHAGGRLTGEKHGRTRLSDEQASAVRCLLANGFSVNACARIFGISVNPILAVRNGTRPKSSTNNWKAIA